MAIKIELNSADRELYIGMLRVNYAPTGVGEHPIPTKQIWITEVVGGKTLLGYWEWVQDSIFEGSPI